MLKRLGLDSHIQALLPKIRDRPSLSTLVDKNLPQPIIQVHMLSLEKGE
jgi:hypothetical protein